MLDQNNLPALVLAETAGTVKRNESGEARESTNVKVLGHLGPDTSRGGQNTLSGGESNNEGSVSANESKAEEPRPAQSFPVTKDYDERCCEVTRSSSGAIAGVAPKSGMISLSGSNGASTSAVVDRRRNQPEQVTDRSNVL